ncbi:MAG: hypothetical protein LUD69_07980 [Oscillospiraceae bacterium]|nr:hypothetical protein [Oscillospiraceae bacterium]
MERKISVLEKRVEALTEENQELNKQADEFRASEQRWCARIAAAEKMEQEYQTLIAEVLALRENYQTALNEVKEMKDTYRKKFEQAIKRVKAP